MANLQIKGMDDAFYAQIKKLAAVQNRSVSQQIQFVVREFLAKTAHHQKTKYPAQLLLEMAGSWLDNRKPDIIVKGIKSRRQNSRALQGGF
jgi:hypothetical protein